MNIQVGGWKPNGQIDHLTDLESPRIDLNEDWQSVIQGSLAAPALPAPSVAEHGVTNIRNEEWGRQFDTAGEKLLYFALIRHCGAKNWCVVGHETLAADCCAGTASIERWLKKFIACGLVIQTEHQYKNCNRYELPGQTVIDFAKSSALWKQKRKAKNGIH
jgi:hypothetical protein